jgi:Uma2 family endonuclease
MTLLLEFVSEKGLGKVVGSRAVLRLRPGRKVEPDVLYLSVPRVPPPGTKEVEGTADLVIEVVSRSTRAYDLGEKRKAYHEAGTGELWFVDRQRRELVQDVKAGGRYRTRTFKRGVVRSRAVPGFWLDVAWLWRPVLPRPLECLRKILGWQEGRLKK